MKISFAVKIKPVPQRRPRFFIRQIGGKRFVGAYDPVRCKTFKEIIAWHARTRMNEATAGVVIKAPIAISIFFGMGQSRGQRFHVKRPDIDNLAKAVKDALRGIVYADDSQIVEAHLYKQFGGPEIRIEIQTLEESL